MTMPSSNDSGSRVVVCGAGAAGMAAALAAARAGASPLLIEKSASTGGTVTASLIHTLGGLFDHQGRWLQPGLARELAQRLQAEAPEAAPRRMGKVWVLNVSPESYHRTTRRWLAEAGVEVWLESEVTEGKIRHSRVESLTVRRRSGKQEQLYCQAVVDCTGTAEVVGLLAPELAHTDESAAAGLIFRLRPVDRQAIVFPRNIQLLQQIRKASAAGHLPALCEKTWIDPGTDQDDAYVKLFIPLPPGWREAETWATVEREALARRDRIFRFLGSLPGFEHARLEKTGRIGIRDGGSVDGNALLTRKDVLAGRHFSRPAGRCQWPIEHWHPRKGVSLEYLAPGRFYEIPGAALEVRGIRNLWVAGKAFSADPLARASARVVGCCWGMGEAAGTAAVNQTGTDMS